MLRYCAFEASNFKADRLKYHFEFWKSISTEPWITQTVRGLKIDLVSKVQQHKIPREINFSSQDQILIDAEISKMVETGIIEPVSNQPEPGEYISNIFIRPKKPTGIRVILNLKSFNENVEYKHFKMQSLQTAIDLMTPGAFMASIDFKQAYYCLGIFKPHRKYLRFFYKGQKYEFSCLPNGLSSGPRHFTKVMKKLFRSLKLKGYLNTSFIDDSFLIDKTFLGCYRNVVETIITSQKAGFVVHPDKSIVIPCHKLVYLGFILNTIDMTVRLTDEKVQNILTVIKQFLDKQTLTIQEVAHLVGKLVSTFPGVAHAKLYYRQIDNEKIEALKLNKGDYSKRMTLSPQSVRDLNWWLTNLKSSFVDVTVKNHDLELHADASDIGWGGTLNQSATGGQWTTPEQQCHINVKELLASLYTLQSLCGTYYNVVIKVVSDNTTCVNYINNQGGRTTECFKVARRIWEWAISRDIWLIAVHLPGKDNIQADKLSRMYHGNTEWAIRRDLFVKINKRFGPLDFDLFATRLNNQLPDYASWKPDPGAKLCDAMSFNWTTVCGYAFPPFILIGKVLKKVEHDKCKLTLIVPEWPSQHWFPKLLTLLVDYPLYISPREMGRISNPKPEQTITANLLVCKISGFEEDIHNFRRTHRTLLQRVGDVQQNGSTASIYPNSKTFVVQGMLIPCHRL